MLRQTWRASAQSNMNRFKDDPSPKAKRPVAGSSKKTRHAGQAAATCTARRQGPRPQLKQDMHCRQSSFEVPPGPPRYAGASGRLCPRPGKAGFRYGDMAPWRSSGVRRTRDRRCQGPPAEPRARLRGLRTPPKMWTRAASARPLCAVTPRHHRQKTPLSAGQGRFFAFSAPCRGGAGRRALHPPGANLCARDRNGGIREPAAPWPMYSSRSLRAGFMTGWATHETRKKDPDRSPLRPFVSPS